MLRQEENWLARQAQRAVSRGAKSPQQVLALWPGDPTSLTASQWQGWCDLWVCAWHKAVGSSPCAAAQGWCWCSPEGPQGFSAGNSNSLQVGQNSPRQLQGLDRGSRVAKREAWRSQLTRSWKADSSVLLWKTRPTTYCCLHSKMLALCTRAVIIPTASVWVFWMFWMLACWNEPSRALCDLWSTWGTSRGWGKWLIQP